MKTKFIKALTAVSLLLIPIISYAVAPPLGTAADFVIFTSVGAVTNAGVTAPAKYLTHLTGNVGTNSDPTMPGFGNVNGKMLYSADPATTTCKNDLNNAYGIIAATAATFALASPIGNGDTLVAGVYHISGATTSFGISTRPAPTARCAGPSMISF